MPVARISNAAKVLHSRPAMLRLVVTCAALAACEPRLPPRSLPELVRPAPMGPIRVPMLMFVPGESMAWSVQAKGITLGRAVLAVDEHEVHSRFETGGLASMFSRVRHELVTGLGTGGPRWATDELEVDGQITRYEEQFAGPRFTIDHHIGVVPDGNFGHTLHSALGAIRAWAQPDAPPGYLYILHAGEVYRIEVARPFVEQLRGVRTLRVELRVQAEDPIAVSMWLRDSDRVPVRFEVSSGDVHVTAELLATDT